MFVTLCLMLYKFLHMYSLCIRFCSKRMELPIYIQFRIYYVLKCYILSILSELSSNPRQPLLTNKRNKYPSNNNLIFIRASGSNYKPNNHNNWKYINKPIIWFHHSIHIIHITLHIIRSQQCNKQHDNPHISNRNK